MKTVYQCGAWWERLFIIVECGVKILFINVERGVRYSALWSVV